MKTCGKPAIPALMLRIFDLFGQSAAMNALDEAMRASGVHPLLVPDAVKVALMRLNKEAAAARGRDAAFSDAAHLLAYCMLGRAPFIESNGTVAADQVERRVEAAIDAGASSDAKLILLAMHSGVIVSEIADRIDIDDR